MSVLFLLSFPVQTFVLLVLTPLLHLLERKKFVLHFTPLLLKLVPKFHGRRQKKLCPKGAGFSLSSFFSSLFLPRFSSCFFSLFSPCLFLSRTFQTVGLSSFYPCFFSRFFLLLSPGLGHK